MRLDNLNGGEPEGLQLRVEGVRVGPVELIASPAPIDWVRLLVLEHVGVAGCAKHLVHGECPICCEVLK